MGSKNYILTIDEQELTDEVRAWLEARGATLKEQPEASQHPELLDFSEEEARVIHQRIEEARNGQRFKSWEEVKREAERLLSEKRQNG